MSCYYFGYHQEHHEYPDVPWWKLPAYKHKAWQSPLSPQYPVNF
ncbi:fatty acid desaturase [Nostoc sp. XA010]|nr:fatty acid desaturase [Nostoc sp. XA010]MCC5658983.1 fatty acid desaturase [Nostoc sp. XA010]